MTSNVIYVNFKSKKRIKKRNKLIVFFHKIKSSFKENTRTDTDIVEKVKIEAYNYRHPL
ncbi:hypothetical protein [Clostridium ihumii]|uniref:hypothetical protein n=1 Tax=Clostridium ihumii TaxID=1470356 RepID=UPI003D328020